MYTTQRLEDGGVLRTARDLNGEEVGEKAEEDVEEHAGDVMT